MSTHRSKFVISSFVFVWSLSFSSCGGNSSAPTPPPNPKAAAPTFSSTAPSAAKEGSAYNYPIVASDPSGGTVTYAVTSGPSGASIIGATLSWTPSHAQSRIANVFTITATTSEGGSASQTFSITPDGNIHGTAIDHDVNRSGIVHVPQDLSGATIEAIVPDGSGSFTTIAGSGDGSGNFSIPNVPAGYYWLHYPMHVIGYTNPEYVWTSQSDLDIGVLQGFRNNVARGGELVTINASLSVSPGANDTLTFGTPDLTMMQEGYAINGMNPANLTVSQIYPYQIDGTKGDRTFILHSAHTPIGDSSLMTVLESYENDSFVETNSGSASVNGTLHSVSGLALHPVLQLSQFDALTPTLNGSPTHDLQVLDVGYDGSEGAIAGINLVRYATSSTGDLDLGNISTGFVTADGVAYTELTCFGFKSYTVNGTSVRVGWPGEELLIPGVPTAATPMAPIIGQAGSVTINGGDFATDQSNLSLTPTVSWSAPSLGKADYYRLIVNDLTVLAAGYGTSVELKTTATALTIPNGVLVAGHSYAFLLEAVSDPGSAIETSLSRYGKSVGNASQLSGMMTTSGTAAMYRSAGVREVRLVQELGGAMHTQIVR